MRRLLLFLLLAPGATTPVLAQQLLPQQPPIDASTRLHGAWLREVLDLDVAGAVSEYGRIAADTRPTNLERWIAVARLAELQRGGIAIGPALPLAEAPGPIRVALQRLTPLQVTATLRQLTQDPVVVMQTLPTEAGRLPDLRPVTDVAQRWVRNQQGPSFDERSSQRRRQWELANSRPRPQDPDLLPYAIDVLRSELQGRQQQADGQRRLYFANWKPPAPRGEPAELLARARRNLETWLQQPNLSQQQLLSFRTLRDTLEQRSTTDAEGMLAMILRVPLVAERLLAEPTGR